jgi:hypothetical protein
VAVAANVRACVSRLNVVNPIAASPAHAGGGNALRLWCAVIPPAYSA